MSNDQHSVFFKAMMTGLFVGIIDTVICLSYNVIYRDMTGYVPSAFINVSSLIFAVNLLLLMIGILFYGFHRAAGLGDTLFVVVLVAVTFLLTWKAEGIHRFEDVRQDSGFHGLLAGVILICGLSAACIPFLYKSRKFQDLIM